MNSPAVSVMYDDIWWYMCLTNHDLKPCPCDWIPKISFEFSGNLSFLTIKLEVTSSSGLPHHEPQLITQAVEICIHHHTMHPHGVETTSLVVARNRTCIMPIPKQYRIPTYTKYHKWMDKQLQWKMNGWKSAWRSNIRKRNKDPAS